jgi:hypothetical protein
MLLIEVLSNDEGSVTEDAKFSAGRDAIPPNMPRAASSCRASKPSAPGTSAQHWLPCPADHNKV